VREQANRAVAVDDMRTLIGRRPARAPQAETSPVKALRFAEASCRFASSNQNTPSKNGIGD
jgi:hypothetical protein